MSYAFTIHVSAIRGTHALSLLSRSLASGSESTRGRLHASKISSNNADRELPVSAAYTGTGDVPPEIMEKAAFGKILVRGMAHTKSLSVCRVNTPM